MKSKKQIEAWLLIKLTNFIPRIGGSTTYSNYGLKRLIKQLHDIVDQLDSYIVGMEK